LLVIELKTAIVDIQDLIVGVDRKLRLAPGVAAALGWRPLRVGAAVIVAEGRTSRRRVAAHRARLRAAFPHDGRVLRGWLRRPVGPLRALAFWPYGRPRNGRPDTTGLQRVRRAP
jgi:hypothetical protein